MTPQPVSQDLMLAATRGPQVDTLGDAFAKAKQQQYTLGNLAQQQAIGKQTIAENAITLAQQERDQADEQATNDAIATNMSTGPDGAPKLNRDGVINQLTTAGRGTAAAKVQAMFTAQDTSRAKQIEAQNAAQTSAIALTNQRSTELARLSQSVEDAAPEDKQAAYTNLHTEGLRLGLITPAMQAQFPPQYDPSQDPHIHSLTLAAQDAKTRSDLQTANLTRTKDQAEIDKDNLARAESWRVSAATQASNALNQQDLDGIRARLAASGAPPAALDQIPAVWSPDAMKTLGRGAMTVEQRATADNRAAEIKKLNTPAELAAVAADASRPQSDRDAATGALKILQQQAIASRPVNNNTSVILTPEAKQMYADALKDGKPLPSFGRNGGQAIGEISNLAASQGPVNMAQSAAQFKADSTSLANTTKTLDNLTAFENTSVKNLKMFTDLAQKQLPDTGVPWLNLPVRMLDEKLVGSENMAAVNAARQVGLREIARVTNDPKMSGQLSDSARHEVMDLSQKDATLPQIMAVAKVIQQDVANVHSSLAQQKADIISRMGTHTAGANPTAPTATKRFNPATGQIEPIKP